ncbi:F-box domain-containing protein [Mycena sanguinolenta]|uniref:F-box domain-containing protein n=1 Tax=Mycena sanguinolenta TaxID=230812 RepID=A0A8H6YEW5_9AGAR|nr:F-box domain-containing protein [Mycena sanguinolenta]
MSAVKVVTAASATLRPDRHRTAKHIHKMSGRATIQPVVCPILAIPPEITWSIFSLYVDAPHIGCMPMGHRIGRGPLRLATVCKSWREICLSHPSLWASFRVYAHEMYHSRIDAFIDFLRCWISRAGNLPLDIAILRPPQNYDDGSLSRGMTKIFSTLPEYSAHVRSLKVILGMWVSFPSEELHGCVPHLERLTLVAGHGYDKSAGPLTGFQDAPRLREVYLSGFTLRDISLPWTQLTHLELGDGFESALEILEQTTQLAVLLVEFPEGMQDDDEPDFTHPPLTLTHLHTVQLWDVMDTRLLQYLTLPALTTLDVGYTNPGSFPILHALGIRSGWSLRTLSLKAVGCGQMITLLESVPSLEEVEIIYTHQTLDPLFKRLQTDGAFLPELVTMKIKRYGFGVSAQTLEGMISVRRTRLKLFHLFFEFEAPARAKMDDTSVAEISAFFSPLEGFDFAIGMTQPVAEMASILSRRRLSIDSRCLGISHR